MKTILRFVVALSAVVVALPATAALNVFACEPEWGALTQELGGDKVSVYLATTALQDPHRIEARPSPIARQGVPRALAGGARALGAAGGAAQGRTDRRVP